MCCLSCRLNLEPGHDVRCSAALLTYKMAAITSRAGPSGGVGPVGQGDSLMVSRLKPSIVVQTRAWLVQFMAQCVAAFCLWSCLLLGPARQSHWLPGCVTMAS
jgi:hypothetical protein